ncbi:MULTISPECIES: ornithine carbamoyltransferase [Acidithiobacillus]|jgi:ornithine carbamoyltransferase|uniref:Ornithine carbamoyltransferase n=3 Tax=root TaxID=1 RepID=B7J4E8_ACIF2|nr:MULTISPECIES: ornithine carbamoyltransferase [Acidithiobacillus]EGQ61340.1 ornithine carbamoyltransferase [Acidithiobacillus sp. GGI-221]MCL5957141.1 ornithine carbamoyltransferase [Gammaproteobacteria bacterium]ACH82823.1 ornithine carbamoyltransferase [Acidithiobacillus ferrooxidans ATCC 53993]ACK80634.1 ornithine carbamoyltransferase [Acidithiobacillus ferrooxidans ATCC 23270]MBN6745948.1 ornithine carbamoyltransferase [Acidithiobacillus sp. MC2.2]
MNVRHFLRLSDLSPSELRALLQRAIALKKIQRDGERYAPCAGRTLAMIFEKSSTRTRVSFETGMAQLGGHALFLSPRDTQLGRGESVEDTAKVISRMVDMVMIRTFGHDNLLRFAAASRVPVINGLSDDHHPCQLLADLMTATEHWGDLRGRTVAYIGDGSNNMAHSWMEAAQVFDFRLRIGSPAGYVPSAGMLQSGGDQVTVLHDAVAAVRGANLIVTDVWTSMGQEEEAAARKAILAPFQVNATLMAAAAPDALFMHCLPAHRGEEVSAEVIDGPRSVVWEEAENRLHAQKALMEFLFGIGPVAALQGD